MDPELEALLRRVLALPAKTRAAIAGSLLDSLDGAVEEGAESAWEREISLRIVDLDSGGVSPIPWSEARRSMLRSD